MINPKRTCVRRPIDFRPTRGHVDSNLIYTVLEHYKGARNTQHSASGIIVQAYREYDPSESEEITKLRDLTTRARAFIP